MNSARDPADQGELLQLARELRARFAINHFKRALLGHRHVPGKAQGDEVFGVMERRGWQLAPRQLRGHPNFNVLGWIAFRLTQRSWENWFGHQPLIPRQGKMAMLDAAALSVLRWRRPADGTEWRLPANFYLDAVHGGLLSELLADSDASAPTLDLLFSRARAYRPLSAWHLHLDALEVRAFRADWRGLPWRAVVDVACMRILEELHRLWRPGNGTIYGSLSAKSGRFWDLKEDEIRTLLERFSSPEVAPEVHFLGDRSPNWICLGVDTDIPPAYTHHLLFALGADRDFAREDRLAAWAMDLATAALVANSLAGKDQQALRGGRMFTNGRILASALDALMLAESSEVASEGDHEVAHLTEYRLELRAAMDLTGGDWHMAGVSALGDARRAYRTEMASLGIGPKDIAAFAACTSKGAPRIFRGQEPPW